MSERLPLSSTFFEEKPSLWCSILSLFNYLVRSVFVFARSVIFERCSKLVQQVLKIEDKKTSRKWALDWYFEIWAANAESLIWDHVVRKSFDSEYIEFWRICVYLRMFIFDNRLMVMFLASFKIQFLEFYFSNFKVVSRSNTIPLQLNFAPDKPKMWLTLKTIINVRMTG